MSDSSLRELYAMVIYEDDDNYDNYGVIIPKNQELLQGMADRREPTPEQKHYLDQLFRKAVTDDDPEADWDFFTYDVFRTTTL